MNLTFANFSFSPSLFPSLAFLLFFPILLSLGFWQMDRAEEKQALVIDKKERIAAASLNLNKFQRSLEMQDRFKPAQVSGEFRDDQQWLLDNRLKQGQPGYHVFSLLQTASDKYFLVNRGWIAVGASREFLPRLPLPEGEVNLQGRLDTPASVGLAMDVQLDSIADRLLVQHLDIAALSAVKGIEIAPLTLVLDEGQVGALDYDWAPVEKISPEKHVGYAVQWFALAMALLVIYIGVNTRRTSKEVKDVD